MKQVKNARKKIQEMHNEHKKSLNIAFSLLHKWDLYNTNRKYFITRSARSPGPFVHSTRQGFRIYQILVYRYTIEYQTGFHGTSYKNSSEYRSYSGFYWYNRCKILLLTMHQISGQPDIIFQVSGSKPNIQFHLPDIRQAGNTWQKKELLVTDYISFSDPLLYVKIKDFNTDRNICM